MNKMFILCAILFLSGCNLRPAIIPQEFVIADEMCKNNGGLYYFNPMTKLFNARVVCNNKAIFYYGDGVSI